MKLRKGFLLAVLCVQLSCLLASRAAGKKALNIAYIYSGAGEYVSSGTIPAVELAAELISNSSEVLPGYEIVLHEGNSEVMTVITCLSIFIIWTAVYEANKV